MDLSKFSDRELAERNYYANLMIFEQFQKFKKDVNHRNSDQDGRAFLSMLPPVDYKEDFEKELDSYIDKNKTN